MDQTSSKKGYAWTRIVINMMILKWRFTRYVAILNALASRQTYSMLQCIEEESISAVDEEGCRVKNGTVHTRQEKNQFIMKFAKQWPQFLRLVPILIAV